MTRLSWWGFVAPGFLPKIHRETTTKRFIVRLARVVQHWSGMKLKDVQIGCVYLIRVSGMLVQVKVTDKHERIRFGGTKQQTVFRCVRVDTNTPLPKWRLPSALRVSK